MSRFRKALLLVAAVGVVGAAGGCYSKVVGGSGIGADSRHLRENHEYGSDWSPHDSDTTTNDRQRR